MPRNQRCLGGGLAVAGIGHTVQLGIPGASVEENAVAPIELPLADAGRTRHDVDGHTAVPPAGADRGRPGHGTRHADQGEDARFR
jgi:hypothetical protein